MIPYLLTSFLLSLIACLVYVLVLRQKADALQQKYFIYFSLFISLGGPLILASYISSSHDSHTYSHSFGFIKPIDQATLQHFCECENPNYAHRISYRADTFYHFLVDHSLYIQWGIFLGMLFVAVRSIFQIYILYRLTQNFLSSIHIMNGKKIHLLTLDGKYPFAAFYLRKPYIIIHPKLSSLPKKNQEAILAHEFSHIEQRNTWETIILRFVQCIWLLNPVFYFFRKELQLISECIADQKGAEMMQSKKSYARLLLDLKTPFENNQLIQAFAQKSLKLRIQRLCYTTKLKKIPLLIAYIFTLSLQLSFLVPIFTYSAALNEDWQTYEKIYTSYPEEEEVMYCTDCEQVCEP